MKADDELCLCFHVSWRKVVNFARINRVKVASQLAECQSAGTGCGWCRRAMRRIIEKSSSIPTDASLLDDWLEHEFPKKSDHELGRQQYIDAGNGKPPN